jgi:nicotinamidase-related amidase
MTNNPNELTIENSAVVLIDHQPWVALGVGSIDHSFLIRNVAGLAQAARDLGVPTVLTTVGAEGSILVDPIFTEISEVFPDLKPIDRTSTHAWSHPDVRAAVEATERKKLIMAGIVTESCLAQSVLGALKDGFDVYFVSDCSGGLTTESHEDAKARMMQAGARPISWAAVITEWVTRWRKSKRVWFRCQSRCQLWPRPALVRTSWTSFGPFTADGSAHPSRAAHSAFGTRSGPSFTFA